jgi:hypothetical protein
MKEGSYVICVDDSNWDELAPIKMSSLPKKNQIYKIRRIIYGFENSGEFGIALEGIFGQWEIHKNIYNQKVFEEYHFKRRRFREIESPETFVESVIESIAEETIL